MPTASMGCLQWTRQGHYARHAAWLADTPNLPLAQQPGHRWTRGFIGCAPLFRNGRSTRSVRITVLDSPTTPSQVARELFAPIASDYERWAGVLSMGQDRRWRRALVEGLDLPPGSRVLDVAAGTGSITRLLQMSGFEVISLDQSPEMLAGAVGRGATGVVATAERLPFPDGSFDGVAFGYLLRYVDSVGGCLEELVRVTRPGGALGMVEFARPVGIWRSAWWVYTRFLLPLAGAVVGSGWWRVGRFLGPSIDRFASEHPPEELAKQWRRSGMDHVLVRPMSLGGGLVMWGRRT
jgi:demethylmenaquinone methyltransferase / 2-methoxy-6-polyprenyl-1,4-benzoquinol methylase